MTAKQQTKPLNNPIQLLVGLGNPGQQYDDTRHNAGFWFLDRCVAQHAGQWQIDSKFHGAVARVRIAGQDVRCLKPNTFMNLSWRAVQALAQFYKISPAQILVVHDELDLPPGCVRLKWSGGHGGHNGLRDTHRHLGADYWRLRVGIGHPGHRTLVSDYVLHAPSRADRQQIDEAIDRALCCLLYTSPSPRD